MDLYLGFRDLDATQAEQGREPVALGMLRAAVTCGQAFASKNLIFQKAFNAECVHGRPWTGAQGRP